MYGAILGDIVGSRVEFSRPSGFNWKKEALFQANCRFTDDTVLTVATKYAIDHNIPYAKAYALFGKKYRKAGYGDMFLKWLDTGSQKGYGSYGNGAAMRVSYIGEYFDSLEEVHRQAEMSAVCTHSHPKGIMAAKATAGIIYLSKIGSSKKEIKKYLKINYPYQLNKPLIAYKYNEKFDATAQGSMPLAIKCFMDSENWEECMRNVFRIVCDTDTICCISGGMADAFYGKTGMDEIKLLERYLIRPNAAGQFDRFLFDAAIKKQNRR